MNNERLERLLWERLDGTISGDDLIELEAVLAEHPEPKELEREIARLAEELENLDQVPPPAELRNQIDHALKVAKSPGIPHPVRAHSGAHASWQRQLLPLAASVVIGVAIGYLLHPGGGADVDSARAAGTIFSSSVTASSPAFEIDLGEGVGTFTASATGSTLVIDAILTGMHETQVVVEAANGRLRLLETEQIHSQPSTVRVAKAVFGFHANGPGTHHFAVEASETTAVNIVVSADGTVVANRTIDLEVRPEGP